MKILLQNKTTRLFVREAGAWTINIEEAVEFMNSDKAIDFATGQQLSDVHVVLWFKEQNYCITMPFQKEDEDVPRGSIPSPKPQERDRL